MDAIRRSSIGFALLVIVWIAVYWWWEPKPRSIAFDQPRSEGPSQLPVRTPEAALPAPEPTPPSPTPAVEPPPPRVTIDGVESPRFRQYTVRRGNTLEVIARRELGSSDLASALARANPLMDPTRLREGQSLRIPADPGNIQGREVRSIPASDVTPGAMEYQVKAGDTLGEISKTVYGNASHWRSILEANRGTLKDERSLRAGQRLLIPPLASGDSAPGDR